ncbi:Cyclin-dependent kinases regulatory subunit 2 [Irineochytrium annulatum]|nr:Cyclin-dependent kinases regulatory subunit 2 [Irineochytrium annulatum]
MTQSAAAAGRRQTRSMTAAELRMTGIDTLVASGAAARPPGHAVANPMALASKNGAGNNNKRRRQSEPLSYNLTNVLGSAAAVAVAKGSKQPPTDPPGVSANDRGLSHLPTADSREGNGVKRRKTGRTRNEDEDRETMVILEVGRADREERGDGAAVDDAGRVLHNDHPTEFDEAIGMGETEKRDSEKEHGQEETQSEMSDEAFLRLAAEVDRNERRKRGVMKEVGERATRRATREKEPDPGEDNGDMAEGEHDLDEPYHHRCIRSAGNANDDSASVASKSESETQRRLARESKPRSRANSKERGHDSLTDRVLDVQRRRDEHNEEFLRLWKVHEDDLDVQLARVRAEHKRAGELLMEREKAASRAFDEELKGLCCSKADQLEIQGREEEEKREEMGDRRKRREPLMGDRNARHNRMVESNNERVGVVSRRNNVVDDATEEEKETARLDANTGDDERRKGDKEDEIEEDDEHGEDEEEEEEDEEVEMEEVEEEQEDADEVADEENDGSPASQGNTLAHWQIRRRKGEADAKRCRDAVAKKRHDSGVAGVAAIAADDVDADSFYSYSQKDMDVIRRDDLFEQISYSPRYYDDGMEYRFASTLCIHPLSLEPTKNPRHVAFPKKLRAMVPHVDRNRLLDEHEWRKLGIRMSTGWVHYLIHDPEPHIFLFRREKFFTEKYGHLDNVRQAELKARRGERVNSMDNDGDEDEEDEGENGDDDDKESDGEDDDDDEDM